MSVITEKEIDRYIVACTYKNRLHHFPNIGDDVTGHRGIFSDDEKAIDAYTKTLKKNILSATSRKMSDLLDIVFGTIPQVDNIIYEEANGSGRTRIYMSHKSDGGCHNFFDLTEFCFYMGCHCEPVLGARQRRKEKTSYYNSEHDDGITHY